MVIIINSYFMYNFQMVILSDHYFHIEEKYFFKMNLLPEQNLQINCCLIHQFNLIKKKFILSFHLDHLKEEKRHLMKILLVRKDYLFYFVSYALLLSYLSQLVMMVQEHFIRIYTLLLVYYSYLKESHLILPKLVNMKWLACSYKSTFQQDYTMAKCYSFIHLLEELIIYKYFAKLVDKKNQLMVYKVQF